MLIYANKLLNQLHMYQSAPAVSKNYIKDLFGVGQKYNYKIFMINLCYFILFPHYINMS